MRNLLFLVIIALSISARAQQQLRGDVIGSRYSVDYGNGNAMSETVNAKPNVFDGNYDTYFASYDRSGTWVGLDLGAPHVITRVGWSPRLTQARRVQLALIEGANRPDFSDAIPLHIVRDEGVERAMTFADVHCSRGFRYVRYVGPNDARCNLAELAFYGTEGAGDDSHFPTLTNLPTVVIHTEDLQEITSKTQYVCCVASVIDEEGGLLTDTLCRIRGRGNASWNFEKKPYRIKFSKKHRVLDSPAKDKDWVLINNYGDKTLMRNIVANEISRTVGMPYTPFCRAVDVVLNGEYRGCYQLMDKIERGKNRVEIEELAPSSNTESEITGGYLMEVDAYYFDEPCYFTTNKGLAVTLHEPDADSISLAQKAYIKRYFNTLETSLYGGNFMSPSTGYRRFFDTQTFLKHFIVGEAAGNTDTYWSVYMYKPRGGKVFTGPVWDFDIAFNNDQRTYPVQNINGFVCFSGMASFADGMYEFLNRIINRDTSAQVELSELWTWARWHGLTENRLCSYVDSVAAALQESQRLNFLRWPIMNQQVHENPCCAGSYDGEVARLKTYLRERLPQLDSFIGLASAVDLAEPGDAAAPYEVFDLDGRPVAAASDVSRLPASLPKGVYIVRHGRSSRKVVVR